MKLSVIICTYNPVLPVFNKVLQALNSQTLPKESWELIIIDNNSIKPVDDYCDISWHPENRIVQEKKAGLSYARITGVHTARHPLIVFVDDDNILNKGFLMQALEFHKSHPGVGCFGGKSIPFFETDPPPWFFKTGINLGCQDYGDELYISNYKELDFKLSEYPSKAPIGTGMVITREAFLTYVNDVKLNPKRLALGRKGEKLSSGEDNDIILTIIKQGYEIAYLPSLIVTHLIPLKRYSKQYLCNMAYESNRTWVKVLYFHGICPWKKISRISLPFRMYKSYIINRAWNSEIQYIRWKSVCGIYKSLSTISNEK